MSTVLQRQERSTRKIITQRKFVSGLLFLYLVLKSRIIFHFISFSSILFQTFNSESFRWCRIICTSRVLQAPGTSPAQSPDGETSELLDMNKVFSEKTVRKPGQTSLLMGQQG